MLASLDSLLAAGHVDSERRLIVVLIQLAVIIAAARAAALLARRLGQPAVVGEILAGLVLGPSLFGRIAFVHPVWKAVFDPSVADVFQILSQLGLIFLLFLIGLEFDFRHLRTHSTAALAISVTGVVAPFALGFGLARWMRADLALTVDPLGFGLFMGTAMSITAIPILGRIMMEMNITRSRLGAVTITAAAVDDATGWILLATVSAMVSSGFAAGRTVRMIALSAAFAGFMICIARPLLRTWIRRSLARDEGELGLTAFAILILVLFGCAICTALIGIFAIFGAFILGAVLSDEAAFRDAVTRRLREFVTVFFLPIFFTYTGLRTDIGSLGTGKLWLFAAAVSAAAIIGKFGGCALAARWGGFSPRESACIGVMMNTRALMELIVINKGLELGVVPPSVFCMLVLMALLTTVMTSPILLRLIRGTELEPLVAKSTFSLAAGLVGATEE